MVDINTLVLPGSDIEIVDAYDINDRGEIAGVGVLPNGDKRGFLLIPATAEECAAADALNTSTGGKESPREGQEEFRRRCALIASPQFLVAVRAGL